MISFGRKLFIIAEAGVNHNGSLELACKLIDIAAEAGADAVKFETFRAEQVTTKYADMAAYQLKNIGIRENQLSMLKKLELPEDFYSKLIAHCQKKKIIFLSTPHGGFESIDFLNKLKVPAFKFGSGDLTNIPTLQYAAKFKKPMIVSTGMGTLNEVAEAVKAIKKAGNYQLSLMHCTTNYPCPPEEVNLRAMNSLKKFGLPVGYSDHTLGSQTAIMAVTLGAVIIEKHITLDRNLPGPDHKASMEPIEFIAMVKDLRRIEIIMGSSKKTPQKSELPLRVIARKSVVATKNISKGQKFSKDNLGIKRPGNGLPPKYYSLILGKKSERNILADSLIRKNDFE